MFKVLYKRITDKIEQKVKKWCGIKGIEDELETLRFIVNNGGIDISTFPKAKGQLRNAQLADLELLRIIHELCIKHQLEYWLDFGTLLGGVRHGGFIPWDDDVDIGMPTSDYIKILELLPRYLGEYGLPAIVMGNLMQGTSSAALAAYQNVSANILSNADTILSNKVRNIETVCKMLDTKGEIVRKMLKEGMDSDSKAIQNL